MAKKLQLLRNQTAFETKALALTGLKAKLVNAETKLAAGEPLIASYNETDGKIGILLAISYGDNTNYQIFEGSKLSEDGGTLEIPQEVQDAIKEAVDSIIGGASEGYDTLKEIETLMQAQDAKISGLQSELDATQVGAGLSEGGSYVSETGSNYIDTAKSLKEADKLLDTALKAEEEARKNLEATVTKNKVIAGDGITVNTEGANTVVSAKVKADNNALKVNAKDGLYVDESALEKYQGTNAIAVSEAQGGIKTISLTIDPSDKVLSQSGNGLLSTLSLNYINKETGSGTPKLQILGKDNSLIHEIDVTDFVMDGMLANAELQNDELVLTFNTDSGKSEIRVNLSKYIDTYTAGDGIEIGGEGNKVISVKLDGTTETFLSVGTNGVKLSGVQTAINQAEANAISTIKGDVETLDTLGKIEDKINTIDTYTVNTKPISGNPVLNGADIALTGYKPSELTNEALNIAEGDTVNVAFGKLEKAILDNEKVCSNAFDAVATAVGLNREGMTYVAPEGSNYLGSAKSVKDADKLLDAEIRKVSDKIDTEVGKDCLVSVEAGNGITVTPKAASKQTISANVKSNDPIIEVTGEGIKTKDAAVWDCGTY